MNYSINKEANEAKAIENNSHHKGDLNDKGFSKDKKDYLMTGEGVICFKPNLHNPMLKKDKPAGFGFTIALDKDSASTKTLLEAEAKMLKAVFGRKKPSNDFFKDGDAIRASKIEEAEGNLADAIEDKSDDVEELRQAILDVTAHYDLFVNKVYCNVKTKFNGYYKTGTDGNITDDKLETKYMKYSNIEGKGISGEGFSKGDTVRVSFLLQSYAVEGNTGLYGQQNNVQQLVKSELESTSTVDRTGMGVTAEADPFMED